LKIQGLKKTCACRREQGHLPAYSIGLNSQKRLPSVAKADSVSRALMARLKPCPFKTVARMPTEAGFSAALKASSICALYGTLRLRAGRAIEVVPSQNINDLLFGGHYQEPAGARRCTLSIRPTMSVRLPTPAPPGFSREDRRKDGTQAMIIYRAESRGRINNRCPSAESIDCLPDLN